MGIWYRLELQYACYIPHSEESASQHIPIPSIIFTGTAFKPQDRDHDSYTQTFVEPGLLGLGLITLDGPMPTFLYHVCLQAPKISSNNGAACSPASK